MSIFRSHTHVNRNCENIRFLDYKKAVRREILMCNDPTNKKGYWTGAECLDRLSKFFGPGYPIFEGQRTFGIVTNSR